MEQTVAAVEAIADVVDRRDPYTYQHSQSVADHSVRIARAMRLPDREVELIRLAARGRELVLAHHEILDGLGYPRGLAGAAIALGARIIAVADSWDAMTSDRPYRKALDPEVALAELLRGRGTQWDPEAVDAFAETLPGAVPSAQPRWAEMRPLLGSLGAAVGVIS